MKFYGWLPTNRGKINFEFIKIPDVILPSHIYERSISSDGFFIRSKADFFNDFENLSSISKYQRNAKEVSFELLIQRDLIGYVKFSWNDGSIYSEFIIQKNGVVCFSNLSINMNSNDYDLNFIKRIVYTTVKIFVHGDAHHHQKIDITLPVIDNEFDENKISEGLLDYIKRIERNVKLNNECSKILKNEISYYESEGYLSYFSTFVILFPSRKVKKNYQLAQNVINSLKQIVNKRREKRNFGNSIITIILTFLGLFISINILLNGYDGDICIENLHKHRFLVLGWIAVGVILFYLNIFYCTLYSYIFYSNYEMFEILEYLKHAKFRDLNWKGKLIKLIPLFLFIILMYLLQYYLMYLI